MAKVNEYRAGIIGCGVIGSFIEDTQLGSASRFGFPNGHAACYDAMHETELVCGADTDAGRRDDYAKRWNLPADRVYADYRDLLKEEDLYIVSIATPSPIHEAPALAAVEAGGQGHLSGKADRQQYRRRQEGDQGVRRCRNCIGRQPHPAR